MNAEANGNFNSLSTNVFIRQKEVNSVLPSPDHSKSNGTKQSKRNPSAIILERIMRWSRVPQKETMHPLPQGGKHYRLVFAVTADVSSNCVRFALSFQCSMRFLLMWLTPLFPWRYSSGTTTFSPFSSLYQHH